MHLGDKYVNHGLAFPSKIGKGKDVARDNSDSVGGFGRDASFVNELTDNGFGKYVQEIEQEGRPVRVGELGTGGKKHVGVHFWSTKLKTISEN